MKTGERKTKTLRILLAALLLLGMLPMSVLAVNGDASLTIEDITLTPEDLASDSASGMGWYLNPMLNIDAGIRLFFEGTCDVMVQNAGIIASGIFDDEANNSGTIEGGIFNGIVHNRLTVSGGTFNSGVRNWNTGTIEGGTFNELVTNSGTISGGTFNGKILNMGGTLADGVNGTVAEGGSLALSKKVYGNGRITIKQNSVDIPSGKAGEIYNVASFDPDTLVGLYMLREGETIPSENFSIDESVFTPVDFLGFVGQYDFTMPSEAVTIAAVFRDYSTVPVAVSAVPSASHLGGVSGGGEYVKGDQVTLKATPAQENIRFAYWLDRSVELPAEPTEAQLKEAIVSYDSTYTFSAQKDISLTAVFAYQPYVYLTRIAYETTDEYFSDEEAELGIRLDEEDIRFAIGNAPVTIEKTAFADTETVAGAIYNIDCFLLATYHETTETMEYGTLESFAVPAAPLYDATEYWQWLAQYEQRLTVAYLRHNHAYETKHNGTGHWTVCACGDATDIQPHSFTSATDTTCNCGYQRHVHNYTAATCIKPAKCSCGAIKGDKDPSNHVGGTEIRNAKDATETEVGYTGDIYCLDCGVMLSRGETILVPVTIDIFYTICASSGEHGSVSQDGLPVSVKAGDNVTFRFYPDKGYEVSKVWVDDWLVYYDGMSYDHYWDCDGCDICWWIDRSQWYDYKGDDWLPLDFGTTFSDITFYDVDAGCELYVEFAPIDSGYTSAYYYDLNTEAWYREATDFVIRKDIMKGVGGKYFDPNGTTTRGQLVTMLYRLAGEPKVSGGSEFLDVQNDMWYTNAVIWATKKGIVEGYGNGDFGVNDIVTREQTVTILYRYAKYMGISVSKLSDLKYFLDNEDVSDYAEKPFGWAVKREIINAKTAFGNIGIESDGMILDPQGSITRVESAQMLMAFVKNAPT